MSEWILSPSHCLRQYSFGSIGHTLNHRQVFSPSGRFAYFDARNADAEIVSTDRIGRIDLQRGEIDWVYRVANPSPWGPGVGAVACHPKQERLIFIHGLVPCGVDKPYGVTRRFGAMLDVWGSISTSVEHAEARWFGAASPCGALRGGTHAHSWSADGHAISFTYNDSWVEHRHRQGIGPADLRTVGIMWCDTPVQVDPPHSPSLNGENFSGTAYAVVVAKVSADPTPGTDAIESAREECFLGRCHNAIAFIGRVRSDRGQAIDEVFISRWPENPVLPFGSCSVDSEGRLEPPAFVKTSRVTRSESRRFPGISAPRSWLITSPDGGRVYCPMRDDAGIVQVAAIDVGSGRIDCLTRLTANLESPLALDESGTRMSMISGGRIGILDMNSREIEWSPDMREILDIPWGAIHFIPSGEGCLFHAYPRNQGTKWQQLWTMTLH